MMDLNASMAARRIPLEKPPTMAAAIKVKLAEVRMLFDWLIIGQAVPANLASAARGPKHVVKDRQDAGAGCHGASCPTPSRPTPCAIYATGC
jgi:hypothetical protein